MAINKVQLQAGLSMLEFFDLYGTQAQCEEVVRTWRSNTGAVQSSRSGRTPMLPVACLAARPSSPPAPSLELP